MSASRFLRWCSREEAEEAEEEEKEEREREKREKGEERRKRGTGRKVFAFAEDRAGIDFRENARRVWSAPGNVENCRDQNENEWTNK